ncbi:Xylulose kinase [Enhygromyxa salina]|uniref:Xylulose kinase n=1 Tax=Enhygromyxa salina TaxID=215803 RepID=A0A2S9XHA7_9BACT|nr:FGGY-family carbohydrate kinase [Enhygromyxa salina]PRP92217.1 Xylulose kinase [Enhygromyxa salina]
MSGSGECVLAIDLGTSGPKVAVVTLDAEVVGWQTRPVALSLSPGGGAEQDPADWWQAICAAARGVLDQTEAAKRVVAVAVTCHWCGTVAVDGAGQPLRPAIIWMDSRGARYVPELCRGLIRIEGYGLRKLVRWLRLTGGVPGLAGKEPVSHLLWLRHNEPEVYAAAAMFLEPKDWLNFKLTGTFAATYDSIATHWVTDNRRLDDIRYHEGLLDWIGVPRQKLPDLCGASEIIGTLTPEAASALGLGQAEHVQVVGGTPDLQSAAVGSGAVDDGQAHIYVGTSSWVTCHVRFKKTDVLHNMASLPSPLPGRYFVAAAQETAGACFEHLRDHFLFADDELGTGELPEDFWPRLERVGAAAPAGSGGLIFTPWLYGERSPVADATLRAGFHNLSLRTGRPELIRSVYEGVAFNTRWLLKYLERFVGSRCEPIRFIGGGAMSNLWCQIMADVLDREIHQVVEPRACNARGAALLASLGLGHLEVEDIPARVGIAQRFEPTPEHRELLDRQFAAYLQIYAKNSAIHRRLNALE